MRRILEGSKGCITRTGEHQIDELRTVDYDKKEVSCVICGDMLDFELFCKQFATVKGGE